MEYCVYFLFYNASKKIQFKKNIYFYYYYVCINLSIWYNIIEQSFKYLKKKQYINLLI